MKEQRCEKEKSQKDESSIIWVISLQMNTYFCSTKLKVKNIVQKGISYRSSSLYLVSKLLIQLD